MPLISGNISGSINTTAFNIPCTIKSFSFYNKTGGAVVATLGIVVNGTDRYVYQASLSAMGSADCSYLQEASIKVPKDCQILLITSASAPGVDYTITAE